MLLTALHHCDWGDHKHTIRTAPLFGVSMVRNTRKNTSKRGMAGIYLFTPRHEGLEDLQALRLTTMKARPLASKAERWAAEALTQQVQRGTTT